MYWYINRYRYIGVKFHFLCQLPNTTVNAIKQPQTMFDVYKGKISSKSTLSIKSFLYSSSAFIKKNFQINSPSTIMINGYSKYSNPYSLIQMIHTYKDNYSIRAFIESTSICWVPCMYQMLVYVLVIKQWLRYGLYSLKIVFCFLFFCQYHLILITVCVCVCVRTFVFNLLGMVIVPNY